MHRRLFKLCLIFSICLLNWSCSLFHPEFLERDSDGYLINHYNSCGPAALERAFNAYAEKNKIKLKQPSGRKEISREIQDSGNSIRLLLSLIHHDTIQMTLPSEMKEVIKDRGFEIINIRELKHLDKNIDIAIILVSGNYLSGEMHWLCFPIDKYIERYFEENTKICQIFLLKKLE